MAQRLYVGNLPYSATEQQIEKLFAEHGEVSSVALPTDRETGQARGFGFVEMASAEGASKAIAALNGRDFVQLTRIIPGVQRGIPGANIDGAGSLAWRASASFAANGQRTRDNTFLLDGVDNNETWLNSVVVFPSIDALEEFKVQTSTYSAEFGRSSGGVVNIQIKSGTNSHHGSLFEFLRNDALDANDLFNNKSGAGPGSSIGTGAAAVISSLLFNTPLRQVQIAMKLTF